MEEVLNHLGIVLAMNQDPLISEDYFTRVYEVVALIPYGKVTSYGAIARYLGSASAARMVGWAMNHAHVNQPKLPAHRVVNRNGLLTGKAHFFPVSMQERLEAEGIHVKEDEIVDFTQHFWDPVVELQFS